MFNPGANNIFLAKTLLFAGAHDFCKFRSQLGVILKSFACRRLKCTHFEPPPKLYHRQTRQDVHVSKLLALLRSFTLFVLRHPRKLWSVAFPSPGRATQTCTGTSPRACFACRSGYPPLRPVWFAGCWLRTLLDGLRFARLE